MNFTQYLSPENIQQGVFVSCKKRALELIAELIEKHISAVAESNANRLSRNDCFNLLFNREKLGTTAINQGVAMPHTKFPSNSTDSQPIAVFLQLTNAIDYEANDHKPVDLIYAVILPSQDCKSYCQQLNLLAERLVDKTLLKRLRGATSAEEIWQIFVEADERQI